MARLIARGKQFFEGERKFHARGVSYGPFHPNSRGERYPEPERTRQDFALMKELGANVVRVYVAPPDWMFEQAAEAGLRLMVGIPWPFHMAFLDSRQMRNDIRRAIGEGVAAMRRHRETIFAYTLGNEIRSDIVRWHGPRAVSRFLAELHDIGRQLDPEALFTYANYPSAEYLDLSFLDFICFNVYLHREADFRRYLTHLLAISGERPLVLSETGMDTIREGEGRQAELLQWQARAAFELGLAGFMIFAFTDEWHTGGSEITQWAFGLVTRQRARKPAFEAVAGVFNEPLPPPLAKPARVSVVVAAYNAAATLAECLASLERLDYPDYETIVVDDGSADSTAAIAEASAARVVRCEHRGLAAARNAGAAAAGGELIAFIDADARADRGWLYHLVEAMSRREAAAAGGPNFPPPPASALAAAIAAAPGAPREVRDGEDRLAQLCGCNMAISRDALRAAGGFDPLFIGAGDDVDLSRRLRARGELLAHAPGATVIHRRRPTIGGYLAQQRGYGAAEGLLFRKYPLEGISASSVYGRAGWWPGWLGGDRIYYSAFGRGLFQTVYPAAGETIIAASVMSVYWIGAALVLIACGPVNRALGWLGAAALAAAAASASAAAALAPIGRTPSPLRTRAVLALLWFTGPLVRSWARECVRLGLVHCARADSAPSRWQTGGELAMASGAEQPAEPAVVLELLRSLLIERGLAVAANDGFAPFDLQIVIAPALRVSLNALSGEGGKLSLRWRVGLRTWPMVAAAAAAGLVLLAAGEPWTVAASALALSAAGLAALTIARIRRLGPTLEAAAREAGKALRMRPQGPRAAEP